MYARALLTLLNASTASAATIYETVYQTFYVTVDGNGDYVGVVANPTATSTVPIVVQTEAATAAPVASSSTSSSSTAVTLNYVYNGNTVATTATVSTSSSSTSKTTSSEAAYTTIAAAAVTTSTSSTSTSSSSTAAAQTSSSSSSNLDSFAQEIVDYHNKVRAQHGAVDVAWDTELASFAANYLNGNCVFQHSGGPYGENIAMGYSTPTGAMEAWYNEYKDYDYSAAQFSSSTGHFTQMVWKGTTKIGCAINDCSGSPYLVCEYSPRGNIIGQFAENVS